MMADPMLLHEQYRADTEADIQDALAQTWTVHTERDHDDEDQVVLSLDPVGRIKDLIAVLGERDGLRRAFLDAVSEATYLHESVLPDVRQHHTERLNRYVSALASSVVLREALQAVLAPREAADLTEAIATVLHDADATRRGEQLHAAGLDDEPARAVEDR